MRLQATAILFCDLAPKVKAGVGIIAPGAALGFGSGTLPPGCPPTERVNPCQSQQDN